MEKVTNITKGTDPSRIQQNKPPFFVSWLQDGEQRYQWFPLVSSMYTAFDRLKALQTP